MKIGIDVDGVLTDFEWFLDFFAQKHFKEVKINPEEYSFTKRFHCNSKDEVKFYIKYLLWYVNKMQIREGAANAIQQMKKDGHTIYIITARIGANKKNLFGKYMRFALQQWLEKNGVPYDDIFYVSTSNSAVEKCEIARKLGVDYFIEDDPNNIFALSNICKVITLNADYNTLSGDNHAIDLEEAYMIISGKYFHQVSFEEREQYTEEEIIQYFEDLKKYYLSMPFSAEVPLKIEKHIRNIVNFGRISFRPWNKIRVVGKEKIPTSETCIYVLNHRESVDITLGYWVLRGLSPRLLIKYEYRGQLLGILLDYLGSVFVNRESKVSGKQAQNVLIRTVLNGSNIFVFPEGTRNRTQEPLLPFKLGAVAIAQITGAPIVPVCISHTGYKKYYIKFEDKIVVNRTDNLVEKNQLLHSIMKRNLEQKG